MLLTIDVGNTNSAIGVYEGNTLLGNWNVSRAQERSSDEIGIFISSILENSNICRSQIKAAVMCSVVPSAIHSIVDGIKRYFDIDSLVIGPGIKTGINIKYENPREVGTDKIANAVGALKLYGGPVIIVDFGTATTFCAVNRKGDYLGGIICPGIKISTEALFSQASMLPRIEFAKPKNIIGRTTVNSMQSGIVHGFTGMTDYIVNLVKSEMAEENIKVVATGGMAQFIANESKTIDKVNPLLTLEGLKTVYQMNSHV